VKKPLARVLSQLTGAKPITLEEFMAQIKSRAKKTKKRKPSWKTACLYPHLQASVGKSFLTKQDLRILAKLQKKPGDPITDITVSPTETGFQLSNLGENFSTQYRKKILESCRARGMGKILLACIQAAQRQQIASLLVEECGGFPEPRRMATPNWKALRKRPTQKQWDDLLEGLQHFHATWPLELLANILNQR